MEVSASTGADGDGLLKREFSLWSAFALAFAFLSPIVALYGIFGLSYRAAGPSFWWCFLVVFGGQLLVALVFAELVSRWPIEGAIYQWSRRLLGAGYGWMAGWIYMWALMVAMAVVSLISAGFVATVLDLDVTPGEGALLALAILALGTAANMSGRIVLKVLMTASVLAEVVGSLGLGAWLLLFHRENDLSALTEGFSSDGYLAPAGPFLVAMAFVGWSFVGFESAGAIAEEVRHPRRNLPRAVLASITIIAVVVSISALAIILAVPPAIAATSADPVYDTLAFHLGTGVAKIAELLFTIGFLASFLAMQTSASRMIWSYARDNALPASRWLATLTVGQKQPAAALLTASAVGALVILASQAAPNLYALMLNFTSGGFYLSFLFPLVGALLVKLRGRWRPGPFSVGSMSLLVSVVAVVWAVLQFLNIAWPRVVHGNYLDWSIFIAVAGLLLMGACVYACVRSRMTHFAASANEPEDTPEDVNFERLSGSGT